MLCGRVVNTETIGLPVAALLGSFTFLPNNKVLFLPYDGQRGYCYNQQRQSGIGKKYIC